MIHILAALTKVMKRTDRQLPSTLSRGRQQPGRSTARPKRSGSFWQRLRKWEKS
jgi:hypothetical protein